MTPKNNLPVTEGLMTESNEREVIGNLKNKPLVEAIFELRWSSKELEPTDERWDVLPGLYYGAVREEYPHIENLLVSQVPVHMTQNAVRHRFRKGENKWPLTQLGPGILTVNDASNYTVWADFLPRITHAVSSLTQVLDNAEPFQRAELRYINAVKFDPSIETIADFVSKKLHIEIKLPNLFDGEDKTTQIINGNIALHIPLKQPKGIGEIMVSLGEIDASPAVIFHINVRSHAADAPKDQRELEQWASDAHNIIDAWFMSFCKGDLMEFFRGRN